MREASKMDCRGFSLIEILVVLMISMALMGIAGLSYKQWMDRYRAEAQVKTMQAEIVQAQLKGMTKNRLQFVVLNGSAYQIVEDTNDSGTQDAAPIDTVLVSKTLNYPSVSPVTLIMDTRGLISTSTSSLDIGPLSIQFTTGAALPDYDCFLLYATRVSIGKMKGADCVTR